MTDVYSKRLLSEELRESSLEADSKRQEDNNKKINKPGRKPLATEPKNKRTAQNRAAQRAFRERKEQKLKDLEQKINALEDEKKSANTESEFLRLQVQMLMNELAKHRGTHDISDLNLPKAPSAVGNEYNKSRLSSNESNAPSSVFSGDDNSTPSRANSSPSDDFNTKPPQQPFSFEFPWSRKNSSTSAKSQQNSIPNSVAPGLASDSSTTSSAESSPFELYNTDDQRDLPLFNKVKQQQQQQQPQNFKAKGSNNNDFQFNEHFDEGLSDFCKDLNQACGTKDCPVPKKAASKLSNGSTPLTSSNTPQTTNNDDSVLNLNDDPLSFLNDGINDHFNTFDPTLAFVNENTFDGFFNEDNNNNSNDNDDNLPQQQDDPLNTLTTEESIYDPFGIFNQGKSPVVERRTSTTQPSVKETPKPSVIQELGIEDYNSDNEVVLSRDGKLLKCTEVWDRITAHPKYSEIDIDGLCSELRSKAKCSDKGVVIDYVDVNNVINNSISKQP